MFYANKYEQAFMKILFHIGIQMKAFRHFLPYWVQISKELELVL